MNIKTCCGCPSGKEIIYCGCDCHKEHEESQVVEEGIDYLIWFSDGDEHPYWVSDKEGYELIAFKTLKQAKNWATKHLREE